MTPFDQTRMNRSAIAGLGTGFVLLILGFVFVVWALNANERADDLVTHSYQVKSVIGDIARNAERAEAARRGYLIDRNPARLEVFENSTSDLKPALDGLTQLTLDNKDQQAKIARLKPIVEQHLEDMTETVDLAKEGRMDEARGVFIAATDQRRLGDVRDITADLEQAEDVLLSARLAEERKGLNSIQLLLILVGLALIATAIATVMVLRRYTRDLLASRTRLHRLNTDLEGAVAERTADLTRANDEIQRFAYIVSHDLRSPLVNIMGFTAELESANKAIGGFVETLDQEQPALVSEPVRFAAKEDLPEAIGFIRTSTQKMDRLINAILDLSRQGRRVLTPELLPMEPIIQDIADNLSTLADERGAAIRIEGNLPDIVHDRLAVEQIFSNLLENATKYLAPGRAGEIVVRGSTKGARAVFEVEDNGRGIAPEDRERVFELFRRAGQQDQKGEGIGLANVRALAYRLGGTVSVNSTLGEGSTFIVDLPREFKVEKEG